MIIVRIFFLFFFHFILCQKVFDFLYYEINGNMKYFRIADQLFRVITADQSRIIRREERVERATECLSQKAKE